ncbi:restriction endonuclease subunit S [Campylobacter armoricus]|uniref:Type I restriction/modification system, specificity subunit n=2 Tax=Campylobacter TaxID=194 RepID=A0A7L5HIN9_9BACT|nr:restriction endonuclease subunit S [Campylobacter armoricus]QKF79278.1 type I restriction/modification system, specificity subunit [Campylobacter armoricus]
MTNLPRGWEVKKLGEIGEIVTGLTPSKNNLDFYGKDYPFFKPSDFEQGYFLESAVDNLSKLGFEKAKQLPSKTILVVCIGSLGKVALTRVIGSCNQQINAIISNKNIIPEYIYYYCISSKFQSILFLKAPQTTLPILNKTEFSKLEIMYPKNVKEQERIVGILDESFANIDESIKNLEQDLLNLDELMQSALQKAFNPLKDNAKENYQLPHGWEWKSLGEICFITDGTHKTPNYIKTGIPFLSVKNISKGFFDLSDVKYISLEEHNKLIKRAKPEFGDILICRIGTLGKAIKISLEFEFSIFVSLGLLKPKVKIISDYLVYFLNSYFIEGWINNNKVGGGTHTAKLNLNILEKCPVALPPLKEQEQIASYLDELSLNIKDLKQNYQTQIKNLQELKKSLLDRAFKGRL